MERANHGKPLRMKSDGVLPSCGRQTTLKRVTVLACARFASISTLVSPLTAGRQDNVSANFPNEFEESGES